jgi:hypothetical protein
VIALQTLTILVEALMKLIGMVVPFAIGLVLVAVYLQVTRHGTMERFVAPPAARSAKSIRFPASPESRALPTREGAQVDTREPERRPGVSRELQATAEEARIAAVKSRMAENLYHRAGGLFAARIASRGVAPADAKAIIRTYFDEITQCVFDAARTEAAARSIELDDFLAALEHGLTDAKAASPLGRLPPLAGLDRNVIEKRAEPCVLDASQEAGIPFR